MRTRICTLSHTHTQPIPATPRHANQKTRNDATKTRHTLAKQPRWFVPFQGRCHGNTEKGSKLDTVSQMIKECWRKEARQGAPRLGKGYTIFSTNYSIQGIGSRPETEVLHWLMDGWWRIFTSSNNCPRQFISQLQCDCVCVLFSLKTLPSAGLVWIQCPAHINSPLLILLCVLL